MDLNLAEFPGWKDWWPSCMREILLVRSNVLKTNIKIYQAKKVWVKPSQIMTGRDGIVQDHKVLFFQIRKASQRSFISHSVEVMFPLI